MNDDLRDIERQLREEIRREFRWLRRDMIGGGLILLAALALGFKWF